MPKTIQHSDSWHNGRKSNTAWTDEDKTWGAFSLTSGYRYIPSPRDILAVRWDRDLSLGRARVGASEYVVDTFSNKASDFLRFAATIMLIPAAAWKPNLNLHLRPLCNGIVEREMDTHKPLRSNTDRDRWTYFTGDQKYTSCGSIIQFKRDVIGKQQHPTKTLHYVGVERNERYIPPNYDHTWLLKKRESGAKDIVDPCRYVLDVPC